MTTTNLKGLLAQQAASWEETISVLHELLPHQSLDRARKLLADHKALIEQDRPGALVVLVGSTGAGKSTLFNALCGDELSTVGDMRPTTKNAVVALGPAAQRADLPSLVDTTDCQVHDLPAPGPMGLGDLSLVDAPDLNTYETEGREILGPWAEHADLLLILNHSQSIVEQAAVDFIADFSRRRKLLLVLGRSDELTPSARGELVDQMKRVAREEWGVLEPEVIAVDSLAASEGRGGSEWQEQQVQMREALMAGALGRIREDNARGALDALSAELGTAIEEAQALLRSRRHALEQALEIWSSGLVNTTRKNLVAHSKQWVEVLRLLAGESWPGPGGWAMRLSGTGSGALGLGLLLGRRNPLVGAGVAAAGSAIDSLKGGRSKQQIDLGASLWPSEKEQKEVIEIASLEAGMQGDQDLAMELEALGQPTLEAAWSSWISTRSNRVWSTPQRYLLRALVDGPLLALGVFCLGLALWGIFGGPGLGMDRLMDSLLVAALWLTGWRWLSGRLLARRASGERSALLGCLETALADAGGTLLTARASVQVSQEGLLAQMGAGQTGRRPRGKNEPPFVLEVGSHGR